MKALSIRQPYAWLIANGIKDLENRTWHTGYRGPVLIHAGKTYPKYQHEGDYACYHAQGFPAERESMLGGIVGIVAITGCVRQSDSRWWIGPVGFTVADAAACALVPCKGELGFFDVPAEVILLLPQEIRHRMMGGSSTSTRGVPLPACEVKSGEPPITNVSAGTSVLIERGEI